jgi:two-component system, cell cycle sensor histidine kinase and response regulator CckA
MSDTNVKNQLCLTNTELNKRISLLEKTLLEKEGTAEALQDSEKRYRRLFESAKDGILILDADSGKVVDVNAFLLNLLGYSYDAICGQYIWELGVFKDIAASKDAFKTLQDNEYIRYDDLPLETLDGRPIAVEFVSNVYLVDHSKVIQCNIRDITGRKKSEEALQASRLQLSEAMDLAHIVYWEFDPVTQTYVVNDPFYAFYGTTAEQEGGYRMPREDYAKRFVHPDDLPRYYQFLEENTLRPGPESVADIEHRIVRRGGKVRHILARTRSVKDDSGRIVKRYGANQDITDRKQMERGLEESEEQFRKMFEGSPIGMVVVGADFHFTRANAAFCEMLGYTQEELTSLTFKDITHPEHVAEDVLCVNDLLSGKIPLYRTEKRYLRKDKEVLWGSTTVNVMRDRDDRFLYFFTTVEDISDRKQAEEEKSHLESQLLQSQKMEAIGTLAGGVAHDFNNILTAIIGFASILQMDMEKDNPKTAYLDQILAAAERAANLTQSLLVFSRKQQIDLKPHKINDIIEQATKLLKRLLTEDIGLKAVLTPVNPAIMADVTQIDQILINLATNARDAMPKGGTLRIETAAVTLDDEFIKAQGYGEPGNYAVLSVSDTGLGMDEKTKEHIFEPFFTTKELGKGTGLGLSTVYGAVKQHGGYIAVDSAPNRGTVFQIYFPLVHSRQEEAVLVPQEAKGGTETILVAEDDLGVRKLIIDVLGRHGYAPIEATDGVEALRLFMDHKDTINLVICDVVMPKMNGREVYEEIKRTSPTMKVLFTSGYTSDVIIDKGVEDATVDFIRKPIKPLEFLTKVREVLDR